MRWGYRLGAGSYKRFAWFPVFIDRLCRPDWIWLEYYWADYNKYGHIGDRLLEDELEYPLD